MDVVCTIILEKNMRICIRKRETQKTYEHHKKKPSAYFLTYPADIPSIVWDPPLSAVLSRSPPPLREETSAIGLSGW